jgi:hypothetical protein
MPRDWRTVTLNVTQGSQLPRIAPNLTKLQTNLITRINSSELFIDLKIASTANIILELSEAYV